MTNTVFVMPDTPKVKPLSEVKLTPATKGQIDKLITDFSVKPTPGNGVSVEALCPTRKPRNRTVVGKRYRTKQPKTHLSAKSARSKSKKKDKA